MKSTKTQFDKKPLKFNESQKSFHLPNLSNQTLLIETYQQVINLQQSLIKQLNINKRLIGQFSTIDQQSLGKVKNKHSEIEKDKPYLSYLSKNGPLRENPSSRKSENNDESQSSDQMVERNYKKREKKASSGSCYDPQSENSEKQKIKAIRQTKHVPKNYGKSIINFILKNSHIVEQICIKENKKRKQFWKVVEGYRGKIYTVAHLRSMWTDKENEFASIFRIMSMLYLRKHSLSHIFNSRVENYNRHLKYRYKIIQGVKNPQNFFRIKEY